MYAVSTDGVRTLAKFREAESLTFPLLSDPDGSAAAKYDALMAKRPYANRITFVIDAAGILRAADKSVRVASHGEDLVQAIKDLRAK